MPSTRLPPAAGASVVRLVAFHFAGGDAFFSGCLLVLAGVCIAGWRGAGFVGRLARMLALIGAIVVAISATPLPLWFYAVWGCLLPAWLWSMPPNQRPAARKAAPWITAGLALSTACGIVWELSYRFPGELPQDDIATVYVIGDSLAAGMNSGEPIWPQQLRERYDVRVVDLSHAGARADSALKQAQRVQSGRSIVVLEIGGNDLLGSSSSQTFAADLDRLLQTLHTPERRLVMLELPLPPFHNRFGTIQRTLAKRYDVLLVPKREFAQAIFAPGATLDGLHFSPEGHRLMAEMIWRWIGPAVMAAPAE